MAKKELVEKAYALAKEQYAELGVDTDKVVKEMDKVVISLHCWQTDDVGGLKLPMLLCQVEESRQQELSGESHIN